MTKSAVFYFFKSGLSDALQKKKKAAEEKSYLISMLHPQAQSVCGS